uniref:Ground-like domain-containing protein n=1 Tax=Plectus sambesii TaxID=2011161 RepID=A0A914WZJ2_9BILA
MNYLLIASALLGVMHMTEGLGFGGSACGGGAPPACPPPQPACPPPAASVCPAPSPCGGGGGFGGGAQVCQPPIPWCAPPPVQNSCSTGGLGGGNGGGCGGGGGNGGGCGGSGGNGGGCGGSGGGCGCRTRRRQKTTRVTRDAEIHEVTQISDSTEDDVLCNSDDLRQIILNNLTQDPETSKVQIHEVANRKLGGHYAVVCTKENFSYIADSKIYCLDSNTAVSCYAFQI